MITIIITLGVIYSIVVLIVYCLQDSMLYFPYKQIEQTPQALGLPYEAITLTTEDGVSLAAWYIPSDKQRAVLLFCHGNAGNISHRLESIRIFNSLGISVFIFDYRGYGDSEGTPSEQGTYRDAEAAWQYLVRTAGTRPENIIAFGESIGCAVAAELAVRRTVGGLIMLAGFTSLPELGQQLYPWLPVKLLSKYRYATIEKISSIACPKLIVHSPDDEIVPFLHGKALFDKAASPKEFLEISGGHNEGFLVSETLYAAGLKNFLDKYCLLRGLQPAS